MSGELGIHDDLTEFVNPTPATLETQLGRTFSDLAGSNEGLDAEITYRTGVLMNLVDSGSITEDRARELAVDYHAELSTN